MKILVLGAGAWGTALAVSAAARHEVTLWARDAGPGRRHGIQRARTAATCRASRCLRRWRSAPGRSTDIPALAQASELVIIATPMAGLRPLLLQLRQHAGPVAWLCKGFECFSPTVTRVARPRGEGAGRARACRAAFSAAPALPRRWLAASPRRWWPPATARRCGARWCQPSTVRNCGSMPTTICRASRSGAR